MNSIGLESGAGFLRVDLNLARMVGVLAKTI
jgi:hypothetical protein